MTFTREDKYIVIKHVDADNCLSDKQFDQLDDILNTVHLHRRQHGKLDNTYVVVNEDESYADIVWALIELGEDSK